MTHNLQKIIKQILTESDSRYDKFIKLITDVFDKTLDVNGKVTNPEYYVGGDENTTWLKYLTYNFRHTFNLMQNSDMKYLYPFAKIAYYDLKFDLTDDFQAERTELKQIINLCKKQTGLFEKYIQGKDLNFKQLHDIFKPILDEIKNSEENIINNTEYNKNTNYEIIEVKSFNLANQIGDYSGTEDSGELCYTTDEQTWDDYTKNGLNKVYCCLSNNWKNIKPEKSEGYPKDEYGLSIIFVFVSLDGELVNSNVRWNHGDGSFGNVDNMFTKSELSELVGVNFNQAFKPFSREELHSMGKIMFDEVQDLLDSGKKPEEIFKFVWSFSNGFAMVRLNNKYNYIDSNRQLLSNQWFDYANSFENGFAFVRLNRKYNYINTNGQLLSNQWFDSAYAFANGLATVLLTGNNYFIDTKGNLYDENKKLIKNNETNENKNINKKVIKINENQLTNIVKESIKRLLKEDTWFKFKEGDKVIIH